MCPTKIFKKCSPNGKIYVYLGQRDFISSDGLIDEVKGIAYIPDIDRLQGKNIFASLIVIYRYGREEDEVMGVSFKKELVVDRVQVFPGNQQEEKAKFQERLIQKLGEGAKAFTLCFPQSSPNSVLIKGEVGDTSQMGVYYDVRLQIGDSSDRLNQLNFGNIKNSVRMSIRKSQYIVSDGALARPTAKVEKDFLFSSGKLSLECNLEKDVFYHGQEIPVNLFINNNGNNQVKLIQLVIVQHCVLTMVAGHYNCNVAVLEITDGCPIYPGSIFNQTFNMKPLAQVCKQERGLALDAMLSKEIDETNLASSSLAETGDPNDLLGIVVSYSVKVTLRLSGMGGKLEVDLPFKLNHPKPESEEADNLHELKQTTARKFLTKKDSVLVEHLGKSIEN